MQPTDSPDARVERLHRERLKTNNSILHSCREDEHVGSLLELFKQDMLEGRMSKMFLAETLDLNKITLSPRFSIQQGYKANGEKEIRPIDDFSRSLCVIVFFLLFSCM